ncbi:MAG: amino acid permease [Myxococcota bacterium]|nr:amino acid permease [Myxococcota bacterium]
MENISTLPEMPVNSARRLGMFGGVFTPSILTILGVVMYLLLPWTVGHLGLAGALAVIVLSHFISLSTGLSVSSIATNRTVGAGGAYYMISRSLGAPAGAAIGLPLFFAQAMSVSFYAVGFAESMIHLMPPTFNHPILDLFIDPRVLGTLTSIALIVVAMRSAEAALKVQYVVMAAIVLSLISIIAGGTERSWSDIEWFLTPEMTEEINPRSFSEVFAVFFPAVTGIMAGVSMSGDLRNARASLPKGTLLAIGAGFVVYMALPFLLILNLSPAELAADSDATRPGVQNYAIFQVALWEPLVYLGLWGATLSSAVGSILSAPRTIQALAVDGIGPRILARGYGPTNEPRMGLVFTFIIAEVGILLGSLDVIAQILTIFFLATYGVTNLACGLERWAANPSYRPTFRVSAWISLIGAAACFYVMSIIDIGAMITAAGVCALIYFFVQRQSLNTTFGDARHGLWSALVRTALHRLHRTSYHDQNWRPNLLIFGGPPERRQYLVEMGATVVQERGITSYVEMLEGEVRRLAGTRKTRIQQLDAFSETYPNVFFRVDVVPDIYRGIVTVTQSYGIGSLEANTVMLGWSKKRERAANYFRMLRELTELENTIMVVKFDESRQFGRRRKIHVWWRGLEANGGIMLLAAYLVKAHYRWRDAVVKVLTVVETEDQEKVALSGLSRVIESARLPALPEVILRQNRSIKEIMTERSGRADLTVIGLRLPEVDEDPRPLFDHYDNLLSDLPSTLLVHAGGAFKAAPVLFDHEA